MYVRTYVRSARPHRSVFEGTSCRPPGASASPRACGTARPACSEPGPTHERGCPGVEGSESRTRPPYAGRGQRRRRAAAGGSACSGRRRGCTPSGTGVDETVSNEHRLQALKMLYSTLLAPYLMTGIYAYVHTVWLEILAGNLFWRIGGFERSPPIFHPLKTSQCDVIIIAKS